MREIQDLMDWFPYCLLVALPVFIALSPVPVAAAHDFPVHRLAHYEIGGAMMGSKLAAVSMDARSARAGPANLLRKIVVVRLRDITVPEFNELLRNGAGAFLFLIEPDRVDEAALVMEEHLLASEVDVPVYFARENQELLELHDTLDRDTTAGPSRKVSAAQTLLNAVASTGYQLASATSSLPKQLPDPVLKSVEGILKAKGEDESQPTIVVVAHYDTLGAAPTLSRGVDTNGSGVIVLLELARLFSRLYKSARTRPSKNLVFLLSSGGKMNYFGSKKFLEDHLDTSSSSELLSDVRFCVCLDSLGNADPEADDGADLHAHVSKPPKEDSHAGKFLRALGGKVQIVHKKINLADEKLGWEHERFSIRRLSSLTFSTTASAESRNRVPTITDVHLDAELLAGNVRLIAEALACAVYDHQDSACGGTMFEGGSFNLSVANVESWTEYMKRTPRFAGLMATDDKVVSTLFEALKGRVHSIRILNQKRDKREPEFNFYDIPETTMSAHKVKPAVFDLILTICIAGYLFVIYVVVVKSSVFMQKVSKLIGGRGSKATPNGVASDYSPKTNGHGKNL